jgi:hypothetical protein
MCPAAALLVVIATAVAAEDAPRSAQEEATEAISQGLPVLKRWAGFGDGAGGYERIHRKLGIPVVGIGGGCIILPGAERVIRKDIAEYNAAVLAHINQHGLPATHRKQWAAELNEPRQSFQKMLSAVNRPNAPPLQTLTADGPGIKTADGKYEVRLKTIEIGERRTPLVHLVVAPAGGDETKVQVWCHGTAEVFLAPSGSDCVYLRHVETRDGRKFHGYVTLDLRYGETFGGEFVPVVEQK